MNLLNGVAVGIVTNLEDPAGEARIQLRFPWLDSTQRSAWAPIAAPLAGQGRGAFFMPEEGDEVLVAFEHGDFAHPFIVGFLWNGVDTPPETDRSNRVIITPGGHSLRFEDENGVVSLSSSSGLSVKLDDGAGSIELSGGGRRILMSGGKVQIL
jgi:uncharacterized protein involved in type VI secretion and phage assembly